MHLRKLLLIREFYGHTSKYFTPFVPEVSFTKINSAICVIIEASKKALIYEIQGMR